MRLRRYRHIHFIGIGGSGMNGIAAILASDGYSVSGSDLILSAVTDRLERFGVQIYKGHHAGNLPLADLVVASSAIDAENSELLAARKSKIPVVQRAELLAELMRCRRGIVIAGTHGKTTTTALIASLYTEAGLDPTFVNGGFMKAAGTHARLGRGRYMIAEADESDASFLHLKPTVAVVTNIDDDHLDGRCYQGSLEKLREAFLRFLNVNLSCRGHAVVCADDSEVCRLLPQIKRKIITYGFSESADLQIRNFQQQRFQCGFELYWRSDRVPTLQRGTARQTDGEQLMPVQLNMPGRHNALNAAAAVAVALNSGIGNQIISKTLAAFQGVSRRFELLGDTLLENHKAVLLIDDYGHHPNEIRATITAARLGWPDRRLIMLFQPHRYSRTRSLFDSFVAVLSEVDILMLMEVYSAGEMPLPGADSKSLCEAIRLGGILSPILLPNASEAPEILIPLLQSDDLLITQGAGDIGLLAQQLATNYFSSNAQAIG